MYHRHKQKIIIGITLIAIICLIASSVFVIVNRSNDKQKPIEKTESNVEIDDRISPLTNQGLILEINRMRDRGLLDKLMTVGNSWKTKPTFYFISDIDGLEYVSKDVQARGGSSEIFFNACLFP